jgi:hypothetical protein
MPSWKQRKLGRRIDLLTSTRWSELSGLGADVWVRWTGLPAGGGEVFGAGCVPHRPAPISRYLPKTGPDKTSHQRLDDIPEESQGLDRRVGNRQAEDDDGGPRKEPSGYFERSLPSDGPPGQSRRGNISFQRSTPPAQARNQASSVIGAWGSRNSFSDRPGS